MRLVDAAACGFTDIDTFRHAFQRQVGSRLRNIGAATNWRRPCDFVAFAAKGRSHGSIKILLGAKPGIGWYSISRIG
jgi:hypothetical protein